MMFTYITISIYVLLAIFVPKRISVIELYSTSLFAYFFGVTTDIILDLKFHLYGYISDGAQLTSLVCITAIYFSINILFLNFFPYHKKFTQKVFYILGWSIFSTTYEAIAVHTDFFYYNGWKLWYSALLYPIIFSILVWNSIFVKKLLCKYQQG